MKAKAAKTTKTTNINKNMRGLLAIFVILFLALGTYLTYITVTFGEEWFNSPFNPRIAARNVENAGNIYDRNGIVLAHSEGKTRVYADSSDMRRAVSHIVGDVYGKSLGAENYFAKYLYGYDQGILDKISAAASGTKGGDVYLTIDANLSEYIYNRMDYNGAVVIMNYKTGEILASVSVPTFDPNTLGEANNEEETGSAYLNRVTQGRYPPGSTMKIVTAAAALRHGVTGLEIDCTGSDVVDGQRVTCPAEGGHGHVNFQTAFEKSCNVYFARLSVDVGSQNLLNEANNMAFNYDFSFADFNMMASSFEVSDSSGDNAWAGIGQYKDLVTPMHNMLISAGIANNGVIMEPRTLYDVKYGDRSAYDRYATPFRTITEGAVTASLTEYMRGTVDHGTATSANIGGATICGKTGTAEFVEDGQVKNHSWFVGFSEDEAHPLAIAVILEGAGFGSAHATPLAGNALARAIELGY